MGDPQHYVKKKRRETDPRSTGRKIIMTEHKSFRISDFSFRDIPGFIAGYLLISIVVVCIGLLLEPLPEFWRGALLGGGVALMAAYLLLVPSPKKIDVAALPQPSESVRAKCVDPNCSLAEVVKAYRDETGLGLSEAKAVVDFYRASKSPKEQDSTAT